MAYMMADSIGKRVIIIASSIPLAILANGLRLVLVILLGLWMGEKVFQSYFHPFSGKLLFACALFVLILETILLNRRNRSLKKIFSSLRLSPSERASLRLKFNQFKALWTKERTE
jgi:exosortase/archaeosortase family protein